ncbi:hypothetical protein R1flu_018580 [Riccia fluitans]|uniref:Uncharacterized protein n=1 Tax=Riccia fluitans TaxID=41844 RepID=A0ABD1ZHB1_9MARC
MYEQSTQILAETIHLGNHMGVIDIDLILEANARFRDNEEWIRSYKEEVKKLFRLIKKALDSLAKEEEVLKAYEQRIIELTEDKIAMAIL